jgi:hydroxyacylglutathione hydrolase
VSGALHLMCGTLSECLEKIPRDGRPLAMICGGGYRSTVAASVLERAGIPGAINVSGGMGAWQRSGLPTTTD